MKKLFFAAVAALALISVSNVFASRTAVNDDEVTGNTENITVCDTIDCDTVAVEVAE
ncbi:MAG: hypothetical protein LUC91_07140 [Prevotella sp.]|nr:hypothetical protein [Prevotella sp.]